MTRERDIERVFREGVESLGGWALKLPAIHVTGLPDRVALLPGGRAVFVELKAPGEKPRKIQAWVHQKLKNLSFEVLVLDSAEAVKNKIAEWKSVC